MSTRFWLGLIIRLGTFSILASGLTIAAGIVWGYQLPQEDRLAFMTPTDRSWDIFLMDVDRFITRRLTWEDDSDERYPAWSPDGQQLAYHSNRTGQYELYISSLDGREVRQLTNREDMAFLRYQTRPHSVQGNAMAAWSPDGKSIAFHSDIRGNWNIFTIAPDGTDLQLVTDGLAEEVLWAWSPDGKRALYSRGTDTSMVIAMVDADGSNMQLLTSLDELIAENAGSMYPATTIEEWHPDWSPDGQQIVFASHRQGSTDIYVMDTQGKIVAQLTYDSFRESNPIWTSRNEIVFVSSRNGFSQIFRMNPDGSNIRPLTVWFGQADAPSWYP